MPQTPSEWTQDWPETPAAKDFDQVGPASGSIHLDDAEATSEKNAAQAAFGADQAGNPPSDPGWDIGKD